MMGFLRNAWVRRALEATLAAVFVYASYHKIIDPPDFAKQVYNYKITPGQLINLVAIYLPWVELVAGAALVLGLLGVPGRRGAAVLVGAMLLVFIAALSFNLLRDHPVACGCFEGSSAAPKTREELFSDMWETILRDAGMLVMAAWALWAGRTSAGPEASGAEAAA